MEKKAQKNSVRNAKSLKLNKETIHLLEPSDLGYVAGGLSRSLCGFTDGCCNHH